MMAAQSAVLGVLGDRLYKLQVSEGGKYAALAENNRVSTRLLAPPRGRILDRFGAPLAANKVNWRALLLAEQTADVPATLDRFSSIIPIDDHDRARIERELKHKRRFIPVVVRDFLSWDDMARIEVNAPDLPGILIDVGTTRLYPQGPLLAHVVGYVAPPNEKDVARDQTLALPGMRIGRAGVEQFHDAGLRGTPGSVQMEVNSVGRVMAELNRQEGIQGEELGLSIDLGLQQAVADRLTDQAASAVVMDCRTGEVLAMVSNPSFDPSLFDSGVSQQQWIDWTNDQRTPLINKAVAGVYPPGSTFKPAVALAAMQAGTLRPTDRIFCPGYLDVGGVRFHCWAKHGHGSLDLHGGIKFSCDVFFYEVARRTGMDAIAATGHQLGLGTVLPIELPHQRAGLIPTPTWRRSKGKHWNGGDTINSGIGQGYVQATPLQLATYCSRVATGRAVEPHLTRTVGGIIQVASEPAHFKPLPMPDEQLAALRGGMFAVVNEAHGTAPKARLPMDGVQMAGKTGSAQVRRVSRWLRESGHFDSSRLPWEMRPHALFIAFAPYDAPQYALSVVVEHGNAAAEVAAPLARDIMMDTLNRDPANRKDAPGQRVADAE
ncbi:penicillin-binding protein 2 [Rhizosaccharibacter radicis]|uniref:Penicillin-binding protein 2 n=1 Tax=Rhizosaccharibacter radicis TaxID=2782605 RepID=A0ABT1VXM4_9PROT|nr:penicillin-binding protein 2 [Acetobacteraceae bacterium KSS12]